VPTAQFLAALTLLSPWRLAGRHRIEVEMPRTKDVTERGSYIIAKALYEFIRLEQSKPIN
jgi:hypothetical protein